jgi:hypothetical protein
MNTHDQDELDRVARGLHAKAVGQVPARTLYALRVRRASAGRAIAPARSRLPSVPGWSLAAAAGVAVFALAIGLRQDAGQPAAPESAPMAVVEDAAVDVAYGDALAAFDEDPELFLWLASVDAQPLAME